MLAAARVLLVLMGMLCISVNAASLEEVIAKVRPSIVAVGTYERARAPQFVFRGTGFAVGDGTLIATNAHVIEPPLNDQRLEALVVALPAADGGERQIRQATVEAIDKDHDVVLLKISGAPLPALRLSASEAVREGRAAAFTGFPIGALLGLVPVTHRAMVSAVTPIFVPLPSAKQLDRRTLKRVQSGVFDVFQLDATAYPGNSGSPLYEVDTGEVLGIVNMVFVKETRETALSQPSGISFAVPVQYLRALLAEHKQ